MVKSRRTCALITGAGSGIGRATAIELARTGCDLVLSSRRVAPLRVLQKECEAEGVNVFFKSCDVTKESEVKALVQFAKKKVRGVDALILSHGDWIVKNIDAMSIKEWQKTIDCNLTGAFLAIKHMLPWMKKRRRGVIVPIVSVAAKQGFPGSGAYCASKYGLRGLADAVREEIREFGLGVSCVYPGAVDTPFWDKVDLDIPRSQMMQPETVARAIRTLVECAVKKGGAYLEDITLLPKGGVL